MRILRHVRNRKPKTAAIKQNGKEKHVYFVGIRWSTAQVHVFGVQHITIEPFEYTMQCGWLAIKDGGHNRKSDIEKH